MVRIRQHGEGRQLFDFNTFRAEVALLQGIDAWEIRIEECLGEGALAVEALGAAGPARISDEELRSIYKGIYQTIDGEFVGFCEGRQICRLLAVDSSYWEVEGSPELESAMRNSYGDYRSDFP